MRPWVCVAQWQEEVWQGGGGWVEAASGHTRGLELLQDIVWGPGWGPSQLLSSRVKSSSNLDLHSQTAPLTDLSAPSPLHSITLYKRSGSTTPTLLYWLVTGATFLSCTCEVITLNSSLRSFLDHPPWKKNRVHSRSCFVSAAENSTSWSFASNWKWLRIQHWFIYFHDSMRPLHIQYLANSSCPN